jgi:hypothetical protein
MHSAGSTLIIWMSALYKLEPEEYRQALLMDYGVAYARTVAGVHYPQDNIAGLNIGQRIIREQLPKFMKDNYGYDYAEVENIVEALSFDWNDFDPKGRDGGTIKLSPSKLADKKDKKKTTSPMVRRSNCQFRNFS